jgi:hypothetical protein
MRCASKSMEERDRLFSKVGSASSLIMREAVGNGTLSDQQQASLSLEIPLQR